MTVKELIQQLQKLPQDAKVMMFPDWPGQDVAVLKAEVGTDDDGNVLRTVVHIFMDGVLRE